MVGWMDGHGQTYIPPPSGINSPGEKNIFFKTACASIWMVIHVLKGMGLDSPVPSNDLIYNGKDYNEFHRTETEKPAVISP